MGNRAVITTKSKEIGIYLHWNGGRTSIQAFLNVCNAVKARTPDDDEQYALATLVGVIRLFFGFKDGLCIGIGPLHKLDCDNHDNGVYIIGGNWEIEERYGAGSTNDYFDSENCVKMTNYILDKIRKSEAEESEQ